MGETGGRPRITELDVLRGFALFGITIVNTVELIGNPVNVGPAYETLLHQRFLPIFSLLFGIGFGLFLDAAGERTRSPRLAVLARLGFLIPFGAAHRLVQPREVLLTYAVAGVAVLLPASFLAGRFVLGLGVGATGAAVLVSAGSALIPGLFLLGLAAQRHGLGRLLALGGRPAVLAGLLPPAVVLNVLQGDADSRVGAAAGVATGTVYVCGILLLLRSPVRCVLRKLAPIGRMALTGYIAATLIILAAGRVVNSPDYGTVVLLGACVFAIELVFGSLWLRHARYGPLEWVWRCLTWWEFVPMRARPTVREEAA